MQNVMCSMMLSGNRKKIDRKLLASFIEYAVEGKVTNLEWDRFMIIHYSDSLMESARCECVRLLGGHTDLPTSEVKKDLYRLAGKLRENT